MPYFSCYIVNSCKTKILLVLVLIIFNIHLSLPPSHPIPTPLLYYVPKTYSLSYD